MRTPAALAAFATLALLPSPARATCDGCCDVRASLAGWSEDGGHWVVTYRHDGGEEELVLHGVDTAAAAERRWSAYGNEEEEPMCVAPAPRLPGRASRDADLIDVRHWRELRRLHVVPTQADWRTAFDDTVDVAAVGARRFHSDPFDLGLDASHRCTAWELRDHSGRTLATLPRSCDDAEPIGSLQISGGYLHPDGHAMLIKVRIARVRLVTEERYLHIVLK